MSPSTRTAGFVAMVGGGVMQGGALLMVALVSRPFPVSLILMASGLLLFVAGAVLYDHRSNTAHRDHQPPTPWDGVW